MSNILLDAVFNDVVLNDEVVEQVVQETSKFKNNDMSDIEVDNILKTIKDDLLVITLDKLKMNDLRNELNSVENSDSEPTGSSNSPSPTPIKRKKNKRKNKVIHSDSEDSES